MFGEQPSAAKWNILGTNDAAFAAGYGTIRTRQGGSSTNWGTVGTTAYDYSASNTFFQAGAKAVSGATVVTFPTAFSQVPIVVATVFSTNVSNCYAVISAKSATTFTVNAVDAAGNSQAEDVVWIAIGQ